MASKSSSSASTTRAFFPSFSASLNLCKLSIAFLALASPLFATFSILSNFLSTDSISFNCNSVSITSLSKIGSTPPATCTTLGSSKHLMTWITASTSLILPKNLLPKPSPLLAPFTNPAISTNSITVGTTFCGFTRPSKICNRLSGTVTTPTLGSMVQKGKFAASAFALDKALNKVDLPTLGKPTIPHLSPINVKSYLF